MISDYTCTYTVLINVPGVADPLPYHVRFSFARAQF